MDSVLSMANGNKAADQWRITGRSLMEFWTRESATPLGDVFLAWFAARANALPRPPNPFFGDLPQRFDDIRVPPADTAFRPTVDSSFEADVSAPNPMHFVVTPRGGPPVRIADIATPLLQRALMADLLVCRGFRHPAYHQVEQTIDGCCLGYMRLLLPVIDETGNVNRIYAFCRPLAGDVERLQEHMVALS